MICFCCINAIANSQASNFKFRTITTKQGLPYPDTRCILKDNDGFVWIGSAGGLFRFDGSNFEVYKHKDTDSTSIASNVVLSLCDGGNYLYCGTSRGLSILDKQTGKFKTIRFHIAGKNEQQSNTILGLFIGEDKFLWIVVSLGIIKYDLSKGSYIPVIHDANNPGTISTDTLIVFTIAADTMHHGFWLATVNGLNFYSYTEKKFYNLDYNPKRWNCFDNKYYSACTVLNNQLWAFCRSDFGIINFDVDANEKKRYPHYSTETGVKTYVDLTCLSPDNAGNLVFGTWQTPVTCFNTHTKQFSYINYNSNDPFSILSSFLQYIYKDSDGNLWMCAVDGISVYLNASEKFIVSVPLLNIVNDTNYYQSYIYDMLEDADTNLWLGTDGKGLWKMNHSNHTFENFLFPSPELYDNSIFSLAAYEDEIWFGTRFGLKSLNKKKNTYRKITEIDNSEKFMGRTIYSLYKDKRQRMWLCSVSSGTYCYDIKSGKKKHFAAKDSSYNFLMHNFSYCFKEDAKDNIWIGNPFGYDVFNSNDSSITNFRIDANEKNGLRNSQVKRLFFDSQDDLWIVTFAGGIARYEKSTGKRQIINDDNELCSINCNDIAEDKHQNIWISTANCLIRWIRKENRFEKIEIPYGQNIVDYAKIVVSKTGKIYVSNFNSIIEIDPELLDAGSKLSKLIISTFNVFDKRHPIINNDIQLSYKENFFSIGYSIPEDIFTDNIEYRYKLNEFDADWVNNGKQKIASYTNVPGGDYIFQVQARTGKQPWQNFETKLHINISKIFYQTWWFRGLMILLMFVFVRIYGNYRVTQQRQKDSESAISYFANSQYTNSNPDEILWDLARNCISRLGFVDCVIYMLNENKTALVQKAALGENKVEENKILNPLEILLGKGIVGSVAITGKTEIVKDTRNDNRYIKDDAQRLSEIAVPILHEGNVIGVIDSEHPKRNFFTSLHQNVLETIASICATKIINAQSAMQLYEKEQRILEIDKHLAEIRLKGLRAQMNPHFIFNALNSIQRFVLENDVDNAEMYLEKFARLMRLILDNSRSDVVLIKDEKELLQLYLDLEAMRFKGKFDYEFIVDEEIDETEIEIPSMIIQPYVENAILHGVNYLDSNGKIKIEFKLENNLLQCIIEDNGVGRKKSAELKNKLKPTHHSVGLKVTEERLKMISENKGMEASVTIIDLNDSENNGCGTKVIITLPIETIN